MCDKTTAQDIENPTTAKIAAIKVHSDINIHKQTNNDVQCAVARDKKKWLSSDIVDAFGRSAIMSNVDVWCAMCNIERNILKRILRSIFIRLSRILHCIFVPFCSFALCAETIQTPFSVSAMGIRTQELN